MKISKILIFSILFSTLFVVQLVCAEDSDSIKIGGLVVLTGQYAMQGSAFREGAELAVDEINSRGGLNGKKLELIIEDTANIPSQALTASRKLLNDGVIAAITSSYPELATGAMEFQKHKIPVVHLWDSSPDIESMGDYIFGIGPWAPSSGEVSAKFAINQLQGKTAVIFHINDPWSELVARYFSDEFTRLGGKILNKFSFNPQENDFRTAFTKTRIQNPEVIYSPITDNIVSFYKQLKQSRFKGAVISSDVIADEHIEKDSVSFEGVYQSQMADPSVSQMMSMSDSYKRKYKKELTLPWFVATAYDGVKLIAHCATTNEVSSSIIHDCISKTQGLKGVSQTLSFNEGGSSPQIESIFKIKNKKLTKFWSEEIK